MSDTKCLIIGSGPAGYTAAIYASRANLSPILYKGPQPGGQLTTTSEVENFPGYPEGISGPALMEDLCQQAKRFGTDIRTGRVTNIDTTQRPFVVTIDSGKTTLTAATIIIATGASAKYLGIPDEQRFMGMGVSACATCDGFFYRNRVVAVVGGGDTACEEAVYLSGLASKVYMIVRKDYLRASDIMAKRVMENPKITILFNTVTMGLYGEDVLEGAHVVENLDRAHEKFYDLPLDGFFLAIGHKPNTEVFKDIVALDEQGYIVTNDKGTSTSVDGIFAAGDVADPTYKQAISAAGMGCRAAIDAEHYISANL